MSRRDTFETWVWIAFGALASVSASLFWLEYQEYKAANMAQPECVQVDVEPVTRVCDAPDYFYRYSG